MGDDKLETIEFISSDESIATVNGREITGVSEGTVTIECRRREDNVIISTAPVTLTVSETDSKPNLIKLRIDESTLSNYYSIVTVNGTGVTPTNITKDPITGIYSYDPGTQITSIRFEYAAFSKYINEIIKFNFNESNVTNASSMFEYYIGTTLDLSDWDFSKIESASRMLNCCDNLIEVKGELDMSNCSQLYDFIAQCPKLETLYLKNIYKNKNNITNVNYWSINLGSTKVKDSCLLYIIDQLPNLYEKGITNNTNIVLTLPPTNTLTQEQVQVAIDRGWQVANVNFS